MSIHLVLTLHHLKAVSVAKGLNTYSKYTVQKNVYANFTAVRDENRMSYCVTTAKKTAITKFINYVRFLFMHASLK